MSYLRLRKIVVALLFALVATVARAATPIAWQANWNDALFAQATKEHRFVLLDLHAVWCHWCHVMDETTYADESVKRLIGERYVAVSIDADHDPDLTSRYGNWGWPATIVLAADGTEIVKRRGYIPPDQMASLLKAIIDDPSPGPSVRSAMKIPRTGNALLTSSLRASLLKSYDALYDIANGGWGSVHKFIDAASMELAYARADDEREAAIRANALRARKTLDNNLLLIDPVWGGVYQYSDEVDWRSPHFEKLMSYQASDLRLYAEAYARWRDPRYLTAANALFEYIDKFLTASDGGFYASQDADVSSAVTGRQFYAYDDVGRRKLGAPKIDTHRYAREAGWAIRSLAKLYDVTGNIKALQSAERGANWVIVSRSLAGGGFRHEAQDRGGPFLEDNVAMAGTFLSLYRSTGDRVWLTHATETLNFINAHLRSDAAGFIAAPTSEKTRGVFSEAVRLPDQNAELTRVANIAHRYTANQQYREMALHGMKYLVAVAMADKEQFLPDVVLADRELSTAPIHIAIVGSKSDPIAQELHAAALRYPADYLQIDWLDRAEGDLPNPEIQYPNLKRAAAFACADGACSSPVYAAEKIDGAVRNAMLR